MDEKEYLEKIIPLSPRLAAQLVDSGSHYARLSRNEYLVRAGDKVENLYILVEGVIFCDIEDENGDSYIDCIHYSPGTVMLDPSFFSSNHVSGVNMIAAVNSKLLIIPIKPLVKIARSNWSEVSMPYTRAVRRMADTYYSLHKMLMLKAQDRYLWFRENYEYHIQTMRDYEIARFLHITDTTMTAIRKKYPRDKNLKPSPVSQ